jgi:hypothetical protein
MTDQGRKLEDSLDVAQREFARHVQEAVNSRNGGKSRSDVINTINQGGQEFYARAVVNHAESIREYQRELSVRPEMTRAALEHVTTRNDKTPERTAAAAMDR